MTGPIVNWTGLLYFQSRFKDLTNNLEADEKGHPVAFSPTTSTNHAPPCWNHHSIYLITSLVVTVFRCAYFTHCSTFIFFFAYLTRAHHMSTCWNYYNNVRINRCHNQHISELVFNKAVMEWKVLSQDLVIITEQRLFLQYAIAHFLVCLTIDWWVMNFCGS